MFSFRRSKKLGPFRLTLSKRVSVSAGALLLAILAGCGSSSTQPSTAPPTTGAVTVPVQKRNDPVVRAEVLKVLDEFGAAHPALLELRVKTLGPLGPAPQRVDEAIGYACQAKTARFVLTEQELNTLTLAVGKTIQDSGSDVATYVTELMAERRRIADLVDCP